MKMKKYNKYDKIVLFLIYTGCIEINDRSSEILMLDLRLLKNMHRKSS